MLKGSLCLCFTHTYTYARAYTHTALRRCNVIQTASCLVVSGWLLCWLQAWEKAYLEKTETHSTLDWLPSMDWAQSLHTHIHTRSLALTKEQRKFHMYTHTHKLTGTFSLPPGSFPLTAMHPHVNAHTNNTHAHKHAGLFMQCNMSHSIPRASFGCQGQHLLWGQT